MCAIKRKTCENHFSPSNMQVLEMELKLAGLMASAEPSFHPRLRILERAKYS